MKNPAHVSFLHHFVKFYNLDKKTEENFFNSIEKYSSHKPNIIFDVTLKDIKKIEEISEKSVNAGYSKKNIHIAWVLNSLELALENNKKRDRVVANDVIRVSHTGVAEVMASILRKSEDIREFVDGDIWIIFNRISITNPNQSDCIVNISKGSNSKDLFEVKKYTAVKIKDQGGEVYNTKQIEKQLKDALKKILDYTPRNSFILNP